MKELGVYPIFADCSLIVTEIDDTEDKVTYYYNISGNKSRKIKAKIRYDEDNPYFISYRHKIYFNEIMRID